MAPPRGLFLDFPLGHTAGPPDEPALQDRILELALGLLEGLEEPAIVDAGIAWPGGGDWKLPLLAEQSGEAGAEDDRAERNPLPQYQAEADRLAYEERWGGGECPTCVVPPTAVG